MTPNPAFESGRAEEGRVLGPPRTLSRWKRWLSLRGYGLVTELNVVQEGLPEAIPLEMCYLGWQESLAQLAKLVEPEIPE